LTQGDPQAVAGVREGQILVGKYRVERVLGVGGMGVVVAAQHIQLDEKVAIKFLLPAMLRNQEVVGRFAREARAAVKIKSEHVARVSDVGTLEDGAPYMVMEFLDGVDLAAWLEKQGPLPIEQAVDFVIQACVGVASAHAIGIVHRDLKPANLFCLRGNDGQFVIKVLDFGISKVTDLGGLPDRLSGTKTATVIGSPYYMSPEQMVSAKDVDWQTDVWALGIILYELVTGARPFVGESLPEIAIKVAMASFAPVRSIRPDAPSGLDEVIFKCLEKDKKRRYANIAELALSLANVGSKQSRSSIERIVRIIETSGLATSDSATPSPGVGGTTPGLGTMTAFEPTPSSLTPLGTMAPSATTAATMRRVRRGSRIAVAVIGAVGGLAMLAGVAWRMRANAEASRATGLVTTTTTASAAASFLDSPAASELPDPPKPVEHGEPPRSDVTPAPPPGASNTMPTARAAPASGNVTLNGGLRPQSQPHSLTPAPTHPQTPAAPPAAGLPPPKVKCDPPYYFDLKGNRVFKPECI
jgi:serine/threonine protein kinase